MPRVASPPTRERLTAISLRILEEAAALAYHGPVRRTLAHRLALAWLSYEGIGLPWHYEAFWKRMAEPLFGQNPEYRLRYQGLTGLLDYWYRQLGWEAPCSLQRGQWKRQRSVTGTNRQPQDAKSVVDEAAERPQPETEAPEGVAGARE